VETVIVTAIIGHINMFDKIPESNDVGHSLGIKPHSTWVARENADLVDFIDSASRKNPQSIVTSSDISDKFFLAKNVWR
jgi:hypothetical protein